MLKRLGLILSGILSLALLAPLLVRSAQANVGWVHLQRSYSRNATSLVPMLDKATEEAITVAARQRYANISLCALKRETGALISLVSNEASVIDTTCEQLLNAEGQRPISSIARRAIQLHSAAEAISSEQWQTAVEQFQLVMADLEFEVPIDVRHNYYFALGMMYRQRVEESPHNGIISSKAFWLADNLSEAALIADKVEAALIHDTADQSWIDFIMGIEAQRLGDQKSAQDRFRLSAEAEGVFPYTCLLDHSSFTLAAESAGNSTGWQQAVIAADATKITNLEYIIDTDILELGLDVAVAVTATLSNSGALYSDCFVRPNLVRNGGFEWADSASGVLGWQREVVAVRGAHGSKAAQIATLVSGRQEIYLANNKVRGEPGTMYLGGGDIKLDLRDTASGDASGWLGVWWDNGIDWLLSSEEGEWKTYVTLINSPDTVSPVASIGTWIIPKANVNAKAQFDNLWLTSLPELAIVVK